MVCASALSFLYGKIYTIKEPSIIIIIIMYQVLRKITGKVLDLNSPDLLEQTWARHVYILL